MNPRTWRPLLGGAVLLLTLSFIPTESWIALGLAVTHRGALEAVTREALEELPWVLRALAALGFIWLATLHLNVRPVDAPRGGAPRWVLPLVALAVATTFVRVCVLHDGMISGDEWNNYFTAALFAQGHVVATPPPDPEAFRFTYFVTAGNHYFSIFPPLWPAILAAGIRLGIAPWVNLLLALAGVVLAARWDKGRRPWILWLLVLSPMFVLTAGSYFASVAVFVLVLAQLWALRRWIEAAEGGRASAPSWALASGLLWGAGFAAHYPTAVGAGIPPLLYALWRVGRRPHAFWAGFAMAFGGALWLGMLGGYHHTLHGGPPWLLPALLYEHALLRIQPSIGLLARGVAYTALHALRLVAWTFPLLPLLALAGVRKRRPGDALFLWAIVGLVALYFFYPSAGGPQYGPRYYFGLLGPLAILAARTLEEFGHTRGGRAFRTVLIVAAVALFVARVPIEERRSASVNAPFRLARAAHLDQAIVFMRNVNRSDTGRNLPGWNGPVLFVQDVGARDSALVTRYPGRTTWLFSRAGGDARLDRWELAR